MEIKQALNYPPAEVAHCMHAGSDIFMTVFNASPDAPPHILTPSTLNRWARSLLEDTFTQVWIEGELSNVATPASGHLYFTLKDNTAQIRCAMFRSKTLALRFKPVHGMHVWLRACVSLYEPRGEFQLIAERMEMAGEGALQQQFEQLKTRLQNEGLFSSAHKRPLPRYARRIGVLTSASGAAIRDVLSVLIRRWPLVKVDVLPIPVQGHEAPQAIVTMLQKATRHACYDVLLITRGGGSLEDLWAFNDEALARSIHASTTPVVSAVGHEVDFSIADFVADIRAPTPSAAAELLVPDMQVISHHLRQCQQRLSTWQQRRLQSLNQHGDHLFARLQAQRPLIAVTHKHEKLVHLHRHLIASMHAQQQHRQWQLNRIHARLQAFHPEPTLKKLKHQLNKQALRLRQLIKQRLQHTNLGLHQAAHALQALSPLATLERGYAILLDADAKVLRSVDQLKPGATVLAKLHDGDCYLRADTVSKKPYDTQLFEH